MYNKLNLWLRKNKLFLLKNELDRQTTHLCLDGGRLSVPQKMHAEFMEMYRQCFTDSSEKYYICEVPTKVSRMYVDMDLIDTLKVKDEYIIKLVKIIQSSIHDYFDKKDIIVCKTKSTKITKNGTEYVKTGIHLIWSDLYVTNCTALKLSKIFVEKLTDTLGERKEYNQWDDVIDSNVYNQKLPSLRMVGSRKVKRDVAGQMVDVGRAYLPFIVIGSLDVKIDDNNISEYVDKSFIRVFEPESTHLIELPNVATINNINSVQKKSYNMKDADELCTDIQEFIVGCGVEPWECIDVRSVIKEKTFYTVKVSNTMYCLNKQAEHGRCGIYFVIFKSGMRQKCFCRCDTTEGRVNGKCSDYSSTYFKLGSELSDKLFLKAKIAKDNRQYNPGNSFPAFHVLNSDPEKFSTMVANTVAFYNQNLRKPE